MPRGNRTGSPGLAAMNAASAARRAERLAARKVLLIKYCPRCARWLSFDEFTPAPSQPDGRRGVCRECTTAYQRAMRARLRQQRQEIIARALAYRQPAPAGLGCCEGGDGEGGHERSCAFRPTRPVTEANSIRTCPRCYRPFEAGRGAGARRALLQLVPLRKGRADAPVAPPSAARAPAPGGQPAGEIQDHYSNE